MPAKYREMCDFHEYYSGQRTAPYLTVFVGGNHEASNYLFELYYGGWVAKNIYYLGAANCVRVGPLRIAGLSGIWKGYNYKKPHHERLPYNGDDIKNVGISHDWPRGVEWKGNWKQLFRFKSHLEEDARNGQLGSVAAKLVMDRLRPRYWFSAHLHCKYSAIVQYEQDSKPQRPLPQNPSAPREFLKVNGTTPSSDAEIGLGGNTQDGTAVKPKVVDQASAKNSEEIDLDLDDDDDDDGVTVPAVPAVLAMESSTNTDEIDLELEEGADTAGIATVAPGQGLDGVQLSINDSHSSETPPATAQQSMPSANAADDIRAQLPASFAKPTMAPRLGTLSQPEAITNKTTKFLALDKCLPNHHFLQLLPIEPLTPLSTAIARPVRLEYDKEWLAITRVFASDNPTTVVPPDKGEAAYRSLIEAQEAWVEEHIVQQGLIRIPEDFSITAPVFDPSKGEKVTESPREYSNNQTSAFCSMLQIPNPFDISEEERTARMMAEPRPDQRFGGFDRGGRGGRGGGFGKGRGRGGFRGDYGGGGRGRGRAKGRA
ncbi:lariat debranching enzyme [Elasticomyces elasticus]|nr:lariat debranching enzyme [Elasticomyces elasticus]